MGLGFLLHNTEIKVNKFLDAFLWFLSLSTIFLIILLSYSFSNPVNSDETLLISNALFMSLHRIVWSLALSYIIFACEHLKSGSVVRFILSHPSWKPIGTMGLSVYITHVIFILFMIYNQKQPYDFSLGNIVS